MFNNYKIIRNRQGQFVMTTTFWKATKYHLNKAFRIIYMSAFTAYVLIVSSMALNLDKLFSTQVTYAQAVIEHPFINFPILDKIATCESKGKQFFSNGVLVKHVNTDGTIDIGKYEINSIWEAKSVQLGYNIYTEEGNHNMAVWLFTNQGSEPWSSSKKCWSK